MVATKSATLASVAPPPPRQCQDNCYRGPRWGAIGPFGGSVAATPLLRTGNCRKIRGPHSSYQRVVQGKCPLHFLNLNGVVCSNTLFSNTSALTSSLLFWGNSTRKILEHLVCSNTSGFQFWGPLARTNFLSALCGLPKRAATGV